MTLRTAHGTGADALLRSECRPLNEIPAMNADDTARGLAMAHARGRPFTPGNRAASGRRPALASSAGMPIDAADPDYKRALGWARRYRRRRVSEMTIAHGGELSAGVCAMLTSEANDLAGARYLAIVAARTGDREALTQSSRLSQSARQLALTALDVAERDAKARPKSRIDPLDAYMPKDPTS